MLEYSIEELHPLTYFTLQSVTQFIAAQELTSCLLLNLFPRNFQCNHKIGHGLKSGSQS